VVSWLSLTKLHTYSTKVFQTKTQTRTPRKHLPKFESESATKPYFRIQIFANHDLSSEQKWFWNPYEVS
jgi:hypothetical protein